MSRRGLYVLACIGVTLVAGAAERIADIRQGTNLGVAIAPDRNTLVVELLGQLWSLPASGGGATPLTSAGETARNPRYSPDGRTVVYQRLAGDQWDLWLLDLRTLEQQPLLATAADEREPDFSADGTAVVFAANRTGHYCLWSIDVVTRVETQLTEESGDASYPDVSEHGAIVYVLERPGEAALRVLGNGGGSTAVYATTSRLVAPSWRPGGGVIAFGEQDGPSSNRLQMLVLGEPRVLKPLSGNEDLFDSRVAWLSSAELIYAADGQLWRRGLANPQRQPVHLFAALAVEDYSSPSDMRPFDTPGPRMALGINDYSRSADGKRSVFTAVGDLWLSERNSPERLTDDAFVDLDPTLWPDGDSVVWASERSGQFELWRMRLRERRATQLTFGALAPHDPAVRPDGKQIAFLEAEDLAPGAADRLRLLDVATGGVTTLAHNLTGAERPAWSADGASLTVRAQTAESVDRPSTALHVELVKDLAAATAAAAIPEAAADLEWQLPPAPADYVVQIGRLFDGVRADYRRHVDLHIHDGRVGAIVSRGALPANGPILDARDATVIPGLIDVHTHQTALFGERLGRAWLAYGVTTVREVATNVPEALERSEAWASGRAPGPRLIVSPAEPGVLPAAAASPLAPVRTYPGIANGFAHSLGQQARTLAIRQLGGAAPRLPLRFPAGGSRYELEVSPGFTAYQDGFSRLIASGTVFAPALGALAGFEGWPEPATQPTRRDLAYRTLFTPAEQAAWARAGQAPSAVPALQQTVARLIRGGGRVAVGSDAPAVPYGLGTHLELALLARAGVANDQVLRIATAQGALALGLEQQVGTLEEGKLADFVVIDGDPLSRITDTLKILAVAKGGVWIERSVLLTEP